MSLQENIRKIDLLHKKLHSLLPINNEQQQKLDKKFRLEFQYNTNHIEGNTLTYSETELLLIFDETRGNHTHREYEEMKGSDIAYELVEELAKDKDRPLTEAFIKQINKVLLVRPYWKEAITHDGQPTRRKIKVGDYKEYPNSVQLQNGEIFHYTSPQETPLKVAELIEWYRTELKKEELHAVEVAAMLHYRFVRIHPFDDGNGRISRLLLNYVLLYFGLPPVIIKTDDKANYLSALRDADTGNEESFIDYIAQQLIWSLELSVKAARNESIEKGEDWRKELSLLKKKLENEEGLTIKKTDEIVTDLISKTIISFVYSVDNYLHDYEELFLTTKFLFLNNTQKETYLRSIGYLKNKEKISNNFLKTLELRIVYEDFKRNGFQPFSVTLKLNFFFETYKYDIKINDSLILSKKYQYEFTEEEIAIAGNYCGKILFEEIEKNISQPKES